MDDLYLHGSEPGEQARLARMNELLNRASLRELALGGGESVLDVGSGLGQMALAMAEAVGPGGRVVGVERDDRQRARARELASGHSAGERVDFRAGTVEALPLAPDERFDVVHARFLLEHLRDPAGAVRRLVEAARPRGRIVFEDDDHDDLRLWPEPAGFRALWSAYVETFRVIGCEPNTGRRLAAWLHDAGATPVRTTQLFFGCVAGHELFPAYADNFLGVVEGAWPTMRDHGLLEEDAYRAAVAAFREWAQRPDAALWYTTYWAEGRKT